jgi:Amino acid synthesis
MRLRSSRPGNLVQYLLNESRHEGPSLPALTNPQGHAVIEIRRVFTQVEDIHHEFGPVAATPLRRGAIGAVLTNPFAGRYVPDILPMMDALQPVGIDMAQRLRAAMDVPVERIESYGKGAVVGAAGELEHGALWHVPGGYAMRELLGWKGDRNAYAQGKGSGPATGQPGNALAIVPSTKKVGGPGTALDVPLTHINAAYVRSHFDAIEVRVPGAPLADEIVFILVMSTGARVHARVGGLKACDIAQWNGLR